MRLGIKQFLIVSILAHAGVWLVLSNRPAPPLTIAFTLASAPRFDVALETQAAPRTLATSVVAAPHHRHVVQQVRKSPAPQPVTALKQISTPQSSQSVQQAVSAASRPAELQRNEIRDRVLSRIRSNLQQYFVYPLLAQREGWQGQVLLGFSVEANGMIHNIHVAAGSGYPILDSSALAALARVPHLYQADDVLQGHRLELQLPVIFRLQGG